MKKLTNLLQWRQFGAFLKVSFLLFVFFPNLHSEINEVWLESLYISSDSTISGI